VPESLESGQRIVQARPCESAGEEEPRERGDCHSRARRQVDSQGHGR
jgi:hypothetical protein